MDSTRGPSNSPRRSPHPISMGEDRVIPLATERLAVRIRQKQLALLACLRTHRVLELALYHALGKLSEPESTHDFF